MASILLAAAGAQIGAVFGGAFLGLSGAAIGQAAGAIIGTIIDSRIAASFTPNQISEGARLESLRVISSTEGAVLPCIYGRMKIGGNIFWATDYLEKTSTTTQGGSGKGWGGGKVTTTTYSYSSAFAVGLCEGPISGVDRVWADGKPFDIPGTVWRVHTGTETQVPDPFIENRTGAGNAPACRGLSYVVFEELPLEKFSNRIPQMSFEVIRPTVAAGSVETLIRAVNLIPCAGEFVYATETITRSSGAITTPENQNSTFGKADLPDTLDLLEQVAPALESVALVVSRLGTDLRAKGKRITFYPFVMIVVAAGNTLPNPHSANAATAGQPRPSLARPDHGVARRWSDRNRGQDRQRGQPGVQLLRQRPIAGRFSALAPGSAMPPTGRNILATSRAAAPAISTSTSIRCWPTATSASSVSTTNCPCPTGATAAPILMRSAAGQAFTIRPVCKTTSTVESISTVSMPATAAETPRPGPQSVMVLVASLGSSGPRISAAGGRTPTRTAPAGWKVSAPQRGCRPTSTIYSGPMIDMGECAVWCRDARPYPAWPGRSDVWGDTASWEVGHWLDGRPGNASLGDLIRALCARSGIDLNAQDGAGGAVRHRPSAFQRRPQRPPLGL